MRGSDPFAEVDTVSGQSEETLLADMLNRGSAEQCTYFEEEKKEKTMACENVALGQRN